MKGHIREIVKQKSAPTLGNLLAAHPPEAGVIEVLGYLQIARDDGHLVNPDARETVIVGPASEEDRPIELEIPLVTFTARRRNGRAR